LPPSLDLLFSFEIGKYDVLGSRCRWMLGVLEKEEEEGGSELLLKGG
jgi:hypothetical protein